MRRFLIGLNMLLLCSCASTSDVNSIGVQVTESQTKVAELDNKILFLETERTKLTAQLNAIDNNGKSLSSATAQLRAKISDLDQSIRSYKSAITTLTSNTATNAENITAVKAQQNSQHKAAALAVRENQALRDQAVDEIKALELEYAQKRNKLAESKNEDAGPKQKDNK